MCGPGIGWVVTSSLGSHPIITHCNLHMLYPPPIWTRLANSRYLQQTWKNSSQCVKMKVSRQERQRGLVILYPKIMHAQCTKWLLRLVVTRVVEIWAKAQVLLKFHTYLYIVLATRYVWTGACNKLPKCYIYSLNITIVCHNNLCNIPGI